MIFKLIDIKNNKVDFIKLTTNHKITIINDTITCRLIANSSYHNEYIIFKFRVYDRNDKQIESAISNELCGGCKTYIGFEGEYLEYKI